MVISPTLELDNQILKGVFASSCSLYEGDNEI